VRNAERRRLAGCSGGVLAAERAGSTANELAYVIEIPLTPRFVVPELRRLPHVLETREQPLREVIVHVQASRRRIADKTRFAELALAHAHGFALIAASWSIPAVAEER
jgi:hypothetical protein